MITIFEDLKKMSKIDREKSYRETIIDSIDWIESKIYIIEQVTNKNEKDYKKLHDLLKQLKRCKKEKKHSELKIMYLQAKKDIENERL